MIYKKKLSVIENAKIAAELADKNAPSELEHALNIVTTRCKELPVTQQLLLVGYTVHYISSQDNQSRFLRKIESLSSSEKEEVFLNVAKLASDFVDSGTNAELKYAVNAVSARCESLSLNQQLALTGYAVHYISSQHGQGRFLSTFENLK